MNITEFEQTLLVSGVGLLITLLGFTIGYMIRWFNKALDKMEKSIATEAKSLQSQIAKEADAREEGDLKLADLLNQAAEAFRSHQLNYERRLSMLVDRDELVKVSTTVDNKMDKFHSRLDDIVKLLNNFKDKMVTREECLRTHNKLG